MSSPIWNDEQEKPLQHLRVLDLTIMLPGPYLTRILAQYGAEVIKVEQTPAGDPTRNLPHTAMNTWLNQGKKSVTVDLKSPKGLALVRGLSAESDVFVESFRTGVMDNLGLGYEALSKINPELLYVSLRGFGGKNQSKAGHDLNFVAASGVGEFFLETPPNYSSHWGDLIGGALTPAIKVLAHLSNPDRRGMQIVSHMEESFRSLYLHRAVDRLAADSRPESERSAFGSMHSVGGGLPHSRYYRCQDGQWVSLQAVQSKHWKRFCERVERPEWVGRHGDATMASELEALFADKPGSHWEAVGISDDICLFRVQSWSEHVQDAGVRSQLLNDPLAWAGFAPNPDLGSARELGQDTFDVLNEMGLTAIEYDALRKEGILVGPELPVT